MARGECNLDGAPRRTRLPVGRHRRWPDRGRPTPAPQPV